MGSKSPLAATYGCRLLSHSRWSRGMTLLRTKPSWRLRYSPFMKVLASPRSRCIQRERPCLRYFRPVRRSKSLPNRIVRRSRPNDCRPCHLQAATGRACFRLQPIPRPQKKETTNGRNAGRLRFSSMGLRRLLPLAAHAGMGHASQALLSWDPGVVKAAFARFTKPQAMGFSTAAATGEGASMRRRSGAATGCMGASLSMIVRTCSARRIPSHNG